MNLYSALLKLNSEYHSGHSMFSQYQYSYFRLTLACVCSIIFIAQDYVLSFNLALCFFHNFHIVHYKDIVSLTLYVKRCSQIRTIKKTSPNYRQKKLLNNFTNAISPGFIDLFSFVTTIKIRKMAPGNRRIILE